jgi:RecJ-like exonuclease
MGWLAGIVEGIGDLIFMATDEEAYWRGWTIERRQAGLGRRYRDPAFDTLATCPHCRGLGITAAESLCVKCTGTGRITVGQPPFPHDG